MGDVDVYDRKCHELTITEGGFPVKCLLMLKITLYRIKIQQNIKFALLYLVL